MADTRPAPRLLLGASLLLWGGITGRPLIGLIIAVAVEAAHWTRTRWEFGNPAYLRAWQVAILLLVLTVGVVWLDSSAISALPNAMTWLPVILFPLQFVQSYGIRRSMSLANLSLFLRKRREHSRKHGLPFRDIRFCFDHVYFCSVLISASLGQHSRSAFLFVASVVLVIWWFIPRLSGKRMKPVSAGLMLLTAVGGGYAGEKILDYAYERLLIGRYQLGSLEYSRHTRTAIGDLGEIKQSPEIQWRLIPRHGELPRLLRVSSYNNYLNTYWSTKLPKRVGEEDSEPLEFQELQSVGIEDPFRITAQNADTTTATSPAFPQFTVRGGTPRKDLFPLPANAGSMVLPAQNIEINAFGSLRVDPQHPVADALILWGDPMDTALPPWSDPGDPDRESPDLQIPNNEEPAIRRFVDQLGIRDLPLKEKVAVLRGHFAREFTYTRYLSLPDPKAQDEYERANFISLFLEETKRGHCEYFATATVFLLRECGVPTRYATGFAVVERDPDSGEALLRGTHGHAWCTAWDEARQTWIDVDLTPPDWSGTETPYMPAWQGLLDRWQILRDNILVWRSQPGNMAIAIVIVCLPLVAGAALAARRLWRSKRQVGPYRDRKAAKAALALSPLGLLEKPATKHLGERPLGTPLSRWLLDVRPALASTDQLDEAIEIHRRLRFDPTADADSLRSRLESLVAPLRRELKRVPRRQA
ncbi:hypothetical protein HAHE_16230 [Haloferula helveola]|uniref:Transglutaminase-like domain-containing protein n=1 Tax=Haloferula helveola TaxID=490095 RepID=A0ABM7RFA5_9BACT|nr:hypothetical protein HAHE_16230 [Haloferula helveola]